MIYNVHVRSAMKCMNKIYFIDSENVGDSWISLLNTIAKEDEILVFYTAKSPHMNYKNLVLLKQSPREVTFIECCEGNNALDFQLSTELGYRVRDLDDTEFIIVSNDTGFDAVVKYWTHRNIPVSRIQGKACSSDTIAKPDIIIPSPENEPSTPKPSPEPKPAPEVIDVRAKEILYIIGKDNLQLLHLALQQLFGTKKGKTYYNAFKSDNAYNNYISKHKHEYTKEKQYSYCSIVFELSEEKLSMPEDFPAFIMASWKSKKNLNSFKSALQSKYKKELSDKYYSMFKTHIKILDKIK